MTETCQLNAENNANASAVGAEGCTAEDIQDIFGKGISIEQALHKLRLRLLDLTGRNRLLNFKYSKGKSLQFVDSDIVAVFNRLSAGGNNSTCLIASVPEPAKSEWVKVQGRLAKPDARQHAANLGFDTSYDIKLVDDPESKGNRIQTLYYAEDLGRHCRKIDREARLAIEETGANMLFLVFGFLEYPDVPGSAKTYLSPLVSLPVRIESAAREQFPVYRLAYTGEEVSENLSLREKLFRDHGFVMPVLGEEISLAQYFSDIERAVEKLPGWRLRRHLSLALLSFANMLLVRDLNPANWSNGADGSNSLTDHPIVKSVFKGASSTDTQVSTNYGAEYPIDEHPHGNLPLIYDADSSQHSALIDVIDGKNVVIEGPPGTGKSQTITNLIAAALYKGKRVLFVAEKLAALEVVKSRLAQAGLDPFVLELHSNKTSKKEVLGSLNHRLNLKPTAPAVLDGMLETLARKKFELTAYSRLINSIEGNNQQLTIYKVLWRAENYRRKLGESAGKLQSLPVADAPKLTPSQFTQRYDTLHYVANSYKAIGAFNESHVWWGFYSDNLGPGQDLAIQALLNKYQSNFAEFGQALTDVLALLGNPEALNLTAESANALIYALSNIAPASDEDLAFELLPNLVTEKDPQGYAAQHILEDLAARMKIVESARRFIGGRWTGAMPPAAEVMEAVQELDELVVDFNGAKVSIGTLPEKVQALRHAAEKANRALAVLNSTAETLNLTFDGSPRAIEALQAVIKLANSAPDNHLHLRHEGLRQPTAAHRLAEAQNRLSALKEKHAQIDAELYLDMLPEEAEIKTAILTLREGDAWYRIFQGSYRAAVGLHKRLQRNKAKLPGAARLAQLEGLHAYTQQSAAWHSDKDLLAAAGAHFNGEGTPFAELIQVAQWLAETHHQLELQQLSPVFDPFQVDVGQLAKIRALAPRVDEALLSLEEFKNRHGVAFPGAPYFEDFDSDEPWQDYLADVEEMLADLTALHDTLAPELKADGVTCGDVLALAKASQGLPTQERELNKHLEARERFGDRFQGEHTDLEPIEGALAYGRQVKRAKLPAAVENILLSAASPANYSTLNKLMFTVQAGWQVAEEFAQQMSAFGDFRLGDWMPRARTEIAQVGMLQAKTARASEKIELLQDWAGYIRQRNEALALDMGGFIELLESNELPAEQLADAYAYRVFASIAESLFRRHPLLAKFNGLRHSTVRQEFAQLDKDIIKLRGQQIAAHSVANAMPPSGSSGVTVAEKTEMALLQYLVPQTRPRLPVRQILKQAGSAVQALKPCLMMGPQAVAQFLEPGQMEFDIVVMDEASQLTPEQAIGAVARGKQLVVVGDPKQLPPTNFFAKQGSEDESEEPQAVVVEAESILDVMMGHFKPIRTLRWHYRSRHESLIAFSNHYFYDGNLIIFPAPYPKSPALGLQYVPANGVYENQMNKIEAQKVVDALADHIQHRPHDSVGVVTLNIKQRDLVAELWEQRRRSVPGADDFEQYWANHGNGLFFKNLENVQGDERDCILISTTFGRVHGANVVRQNFGPISRNGGWRRLNVLFTRARKSISLITSMRPEDIVVDESTPTGTKALRNYLEFARSGVLPMNTATGLEPDSDFEVAVINLLESWGYQVTPQLGVAGFRIDIAVRHPQYPSTYLAAVECDGATYHSSVSARDRDRIRQEILESLGWKGKIWRIWSTDWFRNPVAEGKRLFEFLETLKNTPLPEDVLRLTQAANEVPPEPEEVEIISNPDFSTDGGDFSIDEEAAAVEQLDDEDEALEIEVGDIVSYRPVDGTDADILTVRITANTTDVDRGLLASHEPLAQALLMATVGETVVLRVPARPPRQFVITAVKRPQVATEA